MNNQLYEVQRFLQSNRILISFSGKLTQGLIEEYGAAVKKNIWSMRSGRRAKFTTSFLFLSSRRRTLRITAAIRKRVRMARESPPPVS